MIGRWPAYSWRVVVPAAVTISVTANGVTEPLTLTAGTYRGLGASATILDAFATALATHTEIGAASVAYSWDNSVAQGVITCTSTTGPVVINSATGFDLTRLGVVAGASFGSNLTTTQVIRCECWDGLWSVYGSSDIDYERSFVSVRQASRYSAKNRTQVNIAENTTTLDRFLLVKGRYIDPRYAAMEAYAINAQTQQGLTYGTIAGLIAAQLGGQRDIGTGITTTPWLWRHTSDTDLAGTSIDLMLPGGDFDLTSIAQRTGQGGRTYSVVIRWQATP